MKKSQLAAVFFAWTTTLSLSAQAVIHQYAYTAVVETITAWKSLELGGPDGEPIVADTIAVGDSVTGRFSLDSNSPLRASYPEIGLGALSYYTNTGWPLLSIQFDRSHQTFTVEPEQSLIQVFDSHDASWPDQMRIYGGIQNQEPLYDWILLDFLDPARTVLNSEMLDISALDDFPVRQFTYRYFVLDDGYWLATTVRGALTSVTLVAVVPEPATYVMLAAGFGLMAWRQRARSRRNE